MIRQTHVEFPCLTLELGLYLTGSANRLRISGKFYRFRRIFWAYEAFPPSATAFLIVSHKPLESRSVLPSL